MIECNRERGRKNGSEGERKSRKLKGKYGK